MPIFFPSAFPFFFDASVPASKEVGGMGGDPVGTTLGRRMTLGGT